MVDVTFVGDFSGFMFLIDEKIWEVHMNAKGYLVMTEPNEIVGEYDTWEEFVKNHPEFAGIMVKIIQRKMNETIIAVRQWECQDIMPEVMPVPQPIEKDDCMYHRAYQ
jgi:hypothetical protein